MWQAAFLVGSLVVGQTPAVPSAELVGQVSRLVRQLDDDRPDTRQAAEASLIQLGPDVLELLPTTDAVTSAEVRERITRVRSQLQHVQARRSVEESLVSLDGEMTVAEALRAIQQQTGNTLLGYEEFAQRVTVRMSQVPFWEALDQVLDEGQLTIDPFAGEHRGLMISRAPNGPVRRSPRVHNQGVFRFEPTMVSAVRDLRAPDLAVMRVRVSIAWEPRTTPILLSQPLDKLEARDDSGRPVAVSGRSGTVAAAVESDVPFVELEFPFALPDRSAQRLASLARNAGRPNPGAGGAI